MPYACCPAFYSVVECCCIVAVLILLVFSLGDLCLSEVLGFCSLFYLVHSHNALWDSLSRLMHSGIACLVCQAPNWAVAFFDGLSGL